jgi:hypothetical protein
MDCPLSDEHITQAIAKKSFGIALSKIVRGRFSRVDGLKLAAEATLLGAEFLNRVGKLLPNVVCRLSDAPQAD